MEEIGCKCQTFFISLISSRRKQTTSVRFFSPSLYKFKRKYLLKFCVAMTTPGSIWTFLKPWANQCVFLMEMFFLSYVNETMYLFWNLPFFKMVPPKTNLFFPFLKPWTESGSTNQYSCQSSYGRGWHTSGEGPGETPSALRSLSYLISSLLTDIKCLAKN